MLDLFKEVAEPSRRIILVELKNGPRNVTDLVALTGMKQPNVSNHLAKLRAKGIVRANKVGRQVFYSLASPDVAQALTGLLAPQPVNTVVIELDAETVKSFARLAIAGDEAGCSKTVDALLRQDLPVTDIYQHLFAQALVLVGKWYEVDAIDEAQEHLASAIIERLMARAVFNTPPPGSNARRAVIGCTPGNWHSIGTRMISDVLRVRGWHTFYLGANVPVRSFVAAVEEHKPHAVMVSCGIDETVPEALELIRQLAALRAKWPHLKIAAGGRAVTDSLDEFRSAGVELTSQTIDEFLDGVLPALEV